MAARAYLLGVGNFPSPTIRGCIRYVAADLLDRRASYSYPALAASANGSARADVCLSRDIEHLGIRGVRTFFHFEPDLSDTRSCAPLAAARCSLLAVPGLGRARPHGPQQRLRWSRGPHLWCGDGASVAAQAKWRLLVRRSEGRHHDCDS